MPCSKLSKEIVHADVMWCSLPFHPVWFRTLNRVFGQISSDKDLNCQYAAAFGGFHMPSLRIAWSNFSKNLQERLHVDTAKESELGMVG